DLTVAIEVGVVLAVFLFMRQMVMVTNVGVITRELEEGDEEGDPNAIANRNVPEGIDVYEINGPFFFGAAYKFEEAMTVVERQPRARIIRMREVPAIDATGIHVLEQVYRNCTKQNVILIIAEIHAQPLIALDHSGLLKEIGEKNLHDNIDDALNHARAILGLLPEERPRPLEPDVAPGKGMG
ncbi:MAG: STAS domain-containing protein, partial [Bacteroidota bacterium]